MCKYLLANLYFGRDNIMGLCVIKQNSEIENKDEITNRLLQSTGFHDKTEYVEMYPGKYVSNSTMRLTYYDVKAKNNSYFANREPFTDDRRIVHIVPRHEHKNALKDVNRIASNFIPIDGRWSPYEYMLTIRPTIEEIRKVRGFKTIKEKDLWFCEDWKE